MSVSHTRVPPDSQPAPTGGASANVAKRSGPEGGAESPGDYQSSLTDWHRRATVRSMPRRVVRPEVANGGLYFSPDVVPACQHPLVLRLAREWRHQLLVQHLYAHLAFTSHLEHRVINAVALQLAYGHPDLELPPAMRFDAYKLYCDEAYHALFCADLQRQVEEATGIAPLPPRPPAVLAGLDRRLEGLPRDLQDLGRLLFAVVSETLISQTLRKIPADGRVVAAVREVIADHAEDEARHHAYFSAVFTETWPQLTDERKCVLGRLLPAFILDFLEPDRELVAATLMGAGLSRSQADAVVREAYPDEQVVATVRRAARSTLSLFERAGVLKTPGVEDAFQSAGLVAAAGCGPECHPGVRAVSG